MSAKKALTACRTRAMIPLSKPGRGSMKAKDAVENLRKLADLLEKHGDAEIRMTTARIWFDNKESFLLFARDFPRPFVKEYEDGPYGSLILTHGKLIETGDINLDIYRNMVCEMIEPARPAKFHCPSIFSPEEDAELEAQ